MHGAKGIQWARGRVVVFLVLGSLLASLHAAQPHTPAAVQLLDSIPGVRRAASTEDLKDLLRDNLEQDLLPWQSSAGRSKPLTALDFLNLLHLIDTQWPPYRRNFIAIVAIHNNQYSYWAYPTARSWCTRRVQIAGDEFIKYTVSHNMSFPDVMYIMNGYDKPLCPHGSCDAPVFSYGKCWQPAMPSVACPVADIANADTYNSAGQARKRRPGSDAPSISAQLTDGVHTDALPDAVGPRNGRHVTSQSVHDSSDAHTRASEPLSPHQDILLPVMNHPFDHLLHYPWDRQTPKAFMRAGLYAAMSPNCSRMQLYRLARTSEGRAALDVGIYLNRHWRVKVDTVGHVPIEDHARYRYLINTDGQAASWRLAKLLAMNSVVLKWRSPHIEHYYRSLKPGVHYVDVDESDVLSTLERLTQPEQEPELKAIAARAQHFAYRYLSQLSRTAYARAALERYRGLFKTGDMELLLSTLSQDGKPGMLELLRLRRRLLAAL